MTKEYHFHKTVPSKGNWALEASSPPIQEGKYKGRTFNIYTSQVQHGWLWKFGKKLTALIVTFFSFNRAPQLKTLREQAKTGLSTKKIIVLNKDDAKSLDDKATSTLSTNLKKTETDTGINSKQTATAIDPSVLVRFKKPEMVGNYCKLEEGEIYQFKGRVIQSERHIQLRQDFLNSLEEGRSYYFPSIDTVRFSKEHLQMDKVKTLLEVTDKVHLVPVTDMASGTMRSLSDGYPDSRTVTFKNPLPLRPADDYDASQCLVFKDDPLNQPIVDAVKNKKNWMQGEDNPVKKEEASGLTPKKKVETRDMGIQTDSEPLSVSQNIQPSRSGFSEPKMVGDYCEFEKGKIYHFKGRLILMQIDSTIRLHKDFLSALKEGSSNYFVQVSTPRFEKVNKSMLQSLLEVSGEVHLIALHLARASFPLDAFNYPKTLTFNQSILAEWLEKGQKGEKGEEDYFVRAHPDQIAALKKKSNWGRKIKSLE